MFIFFSINDSSIIQESFLTSTNTGDAFTYLTQFAEATKDKEGTITSSKDEIDKDDVLYLHKDSLPKLDTKDVFNKKRMCIGIAEFYVKISHLFAAITTTIKTNI